MSFHLSYLLSVLLINTFWNGIRPNTIFKIATYDSLTKTKDIPWTGYTFGSEKPSIRKHKSTPKELKEYQEEQKILESSKKFFKNQIIEQESFSILSTFLIHKKGTDFFEILKLSKGNKQTIIGTPRSLSVWIYGYQQKHIVYAHFYNKRDVLLKIGDLNFSGWKRKEIILPSFMLTSPKIENTLRKEFKFVGFKIQTNKNEKKNLAIFHFSRICFLLEYQQVSEYDKVPF